MTTNPEMTFENHEITLEQLEAVLEPVIVAEDPEVSLRHPKQIRREHDAANFLATFAEVESALDEYSPGREAVEEDYRKQARHDAGQIAHARPEQRRLSYIDCYNAALRRLEIANAVQGGPLEGVGADVFYDIYLPVLDSALEELNIAVVAPRDLRQFGESRD